MAKKQTRRSISVSRTTYERLKAFCEANNISMSQLVETRVNEALGNETGDAPALPPPRPTPITPVRQTAPLGHHSMPTAVASVERPAPRPAPVAERPAAQPVPMTSVAARYAIEPPPPIIKPRQETAAPKPAEKRPDQIFTF